MFFWVFNSAPEKYSIPENEIQRYRIVPRITQLHPTSEDSDMENQSNENRNAFASLDRRGTMKTSSFIRKFRPSLRHGSHSSEIIFS